MLMLQALLALLQLPLLLFLHFVHVMIHAAWQLLHAARPVKSCLNIVSIWASSTLPTIGGRPAGHITMPAQQRQQRDVDIWPICRQHCAAARRTLGTCLVPCSSGFNRQGQAGNGQCW